MTAQKLLLPVPLYDKPGCRDWYLVDLSSVEEGGPLVDATRWRIGVAERGGRTKGLPVLVARRLAEIVRGREINDKDIAEVVRVPFPANDS